VTPGATPNVPGPSASSTERLDRRQALFYSLGNVAGGVYNGFNLGVLSIYLSGFMGPLLQGYLSNTKTMEGTVIQPIVGRLSDRTASRFGRRRPFIGIFAPLSVIFLIAIPYLHGAGHAARVPLIAVSIILFSICANIAADPYGALMIDITPAPIRPRFSAVLQIVSTVFQLLFVAFALVVSIRKDNIPSYVFWVAGAIMLLCYLSVFLGVREPDAAQRAALREERVPVRRYIADLRQFTQAQKLLLSYFFLWTGLNPLVVYIARFVKHDFKASNAKALAIELTLFALVAFFAYPWGRLQRRYGYRSCITAGTILMMAAALIALAVRSYVLLFPVAILAGAGFSATTVLNYPYLSTLVPSSKMGIFTGLQAAFTSVAVPVSTVIASLLITKIDYRAIFAMQFVLMVVDLLILWRVNEGQARDEVSRVEHEEKEVARRPVPAPVS